MPLILAVAGIGILGVAAVASRQSRLKREKEKELAAANAEVEFQEATYTGEAADSAYDGNVFVGENYASGTQAPEGSTSSEAGRREEEILGIDEEELQKRKNLIRTVNGSVSMAGSMSFSLYEGRRRRKNGTGDEWVVSQAAYDEIEGLPSYMELYELPDYALLEVENILQEPELPTGCESVSLAMALNSLGFDVGKTEIADNYLPYAEEIEDITIAYIGDPYSYEGAGIYAPGLAVTANRYLHSQGSSYRAYNATGLELEELFQYLVMDRPVCIWVTMYYDDVMETEASSEFRGREYYWYWNEHCVMLAGYDMEEGVVGIQDPMLGEVWMDMDIVKDIYDTIGKMAIVII